MRLAPFGRKVVLSAAAVSCVLAGCAWWLGGGPWSLFGMLPAVFTLYFFRDPERKVPEGKHLVLAPADGKVTAVERVNEPEFVEEPAWRISIFLSIFDVHLNRAPLSGRVAYVRHREGRFLNALRAESAERNEQNSIGMVSERDDRVLVKQIAGAIARRIVCAVEPGAEVKAGEKVGMIMFGSRTDLLLPCRAFRVTVRPGDVVRAGSSVVGEAIR